MNLSSWEYIDRNEKVEVIGNNNKQPTSLFKYYSLSDYNLDAIENTYFYFPHPDDLNDPFDSYFRRLKLSSLTKEQFKNIFYKYFHLVFPDEEPSYSRVAKIVDAGFLNEKSESTFRQISIPLYWNIICSKVGVLCLADTEHSMLLWSYYTNHVGFSVKYVDLEFGSSVMGPYPMNYSRVYDFVFPEKEEIEFEKLVYLLNIKSEEWKHENEWRYILQREDLSIPEYDKSQPRVNNRKVFYSHKVIQSITLGYKFFKGNVTRTYIGENAYLYSFNRDSESDRLKVRLINFIIANKIQVKQVHTNDDNSFTLTAFPISIKVKEKDQEYLVETLL